MTFKDLEKMLKNDGWEYQYTRGSHYYYSHKKKSGKITIPRHNNRDINIKTADSILKQAGLK